ncbi:MAG: TrkH family potassium uptake protein [Phycisphaeraceae bacterium]|nr:TrkH family potassium uptake protein [Phycisphaeraceae bacterium]
MNIRFVLRQFGLVIMVLCACMALTMCWSLVQWRAKMVDERSAALSLLIAVGVALVAGITLWVIGRGGMDRFFGRREALLLVALSWVIGAAVAALPFFIWARFDPAHPQGHRFEHFVDCYFESMSGLTTTGATVLSDISTLPQGLLLWRAATHWLGGLGIVVLFVAVLPHMGTGGKRMFMAEITGPNKTGLRPRIRDTARMLLLIYLGLNVAEILSLRLCGLSWFDAVCESFATIATGGFSTQNASTAGYRSLAVELVIILFMLLSGVNFALYFSLVNGRVRRVLTDPELRLYLLTTLAAVVIVAVAIYGGSIITANGDSVEADAGYAARYAAFAVIATRTNTGFATADVNPWGFLPALILILFMFTGACAGSTAGGIKLVRCLVVVKMLAAGTRRVFRPSLVQPIRIGRNLVPPSVQTEALTYTVIYLLVFALGGTAVQLLEPSGHTNLVTSFSASVACLSNTGPGLNLVGTVQNYGWLSPGSKLVLSLVMLLGRIEVFAILALFNPSFWRRE